MKEIESLIKDLQAERLRPGERGAKYLHDNGTDSLLLQAANALTSLRTGGLTFAQLAAINLPRAMRWHPGGIEEWNAAEWSNAMCGEAGEAANATKKLRRIECKMQQHGGDSGGPADMAEAQRRVLKEVGDTVIYADLLCQRVGGRMEDAVRIAFNAVSEREGFPERLP